MYPYYYLNEESFKSRASITSPKQFKSLRPKPSPTSKTLQPISFTPIGTENQPKKSAPSPRSISHSRLTGVPRAARETPLRGRRPRNFTKEAARPAATPEAVRAEGGWNARGGAAQGEQPRRIWAAVAGKNRRAKSTRGPIASFAPARPEKASPRRISRGGFAAKTGRRAGNPWDSWAKIRRTVRAAGSGRRMGSRGIVGE